mgnify:CR=1 FL=1
MLLQAKHFDFAIDTIKSPKNPHRLPAGPYMSQEAHKGNSSIPKPILANIIGVSNLPG